jgi:FkbM family methyltransferase
MHNLFSLYQFLFSRSWWYWWHLHIYKLTLRGMGVLNSDTEIATGEPWFLARLQELTAAGEIKMRTIVDVGANDLAYGQEEFEQAKIYAFEPHPESFRRLQRGAAKNVVSIEAAVGEKAGTIDFWDFADGAPRKKEQPTSQLASIHKEVIEKMYGQPAKKYRVKMTTLDVFAKENRIKHIDLLKIDAEGNELAVLKGASGLLDANKIDIIQFEFNEIHAYSRVFMKDFYDLLPKFSFFRLLPKGAVALGQYRPLTHEIFGFQNIVAIRNKTPWGVLFALETPDE